MADRALEPEFLVVGHLSKPHGNKGELLVWPLTDRPDEVLAPGRALLLGDEEGAAGEEPVRVTVAASRPYRKGFLVRFKGVEDRTAAELLAARYLLERADALGEAGEDEAYYHELLGLRVETTDGTLVGRVREVYELDPAHMLEVKGETGVHLVPFTSRVVVEVDRAGGRLVIDPPEGLLEL
ncbi:MAG TPA: ribosome maturation factor RimM [Longimicrobiales bacterium]|nr:ribosome maturation factor RimM [Longimicrobiales bacterium]